MQYSSSDEGSLKRLNISAIFGGKIIKVNTNK